MNIRDKVLLLFSRFSFFPGRLINAGALAIDVCWKDLTLISWELSILRRISSFLHDFLP